MAGLNFASGLHCSVGGTEGIGDGFFGAADAGFGGLVEEDAEEVRAALVGGEAFKRAWAFGLWAKRDSRTGGVCCSPSMVRRKRSAI